MAYFPLCCPFFQCWDRIRLPLPCLLLTYTLQVSTATQGDCYHLIKSLHAEMKKQQCSFIHNLRREACPPSLSLPYSSIPSLCFCLSLANSLSTSYFALAGNPVQGFHSEDIIWHLLSQSLQCLIIPSCLCPIVFGFYCHSYLFLLFFLSYSCLLLISDNLSMLFSALVLTWHSYPLCVDLLCRYVCIHFINHIYTGNFLSQYACLLGNV